MLQLNNFDAELGQAIDVACNHIALDHKAYVFRCARVVMSQSFPKDTY